MVSTGVRSVSSVLACLVVLGCAAVGCSRRGEADDGRAGPRRGGTITLLTESNGFTHLDPQLNYTTSALNVGRLIYRTLTAFRGTPSNPAGVLRPDLATDLGRASADNRVWAFTLRPGTAWEDGRPVTCEQVRYGVERSFAPGNAGGPAYPRELLAGGDDYHGPADGDLSSVTCSGRTIRFRLDQPCGDFGDVVAMPVFAPVRPDVDARGGYDRRPMSDGPYVIAERDEHRMVLTRNPYWRADTDPVRPAYPDRFVVRFGADPVVSTNDLVNDTGRTRNAIQLDYNVPPNFVQQVINDPTLAGRTVSGLTGAIRYLAINTTRVRELRCRRALGYALDKSAYRMVVGGFVAGEYATTMIPPGVPAHRSVDPYGKKDRPGGDTHRAAVLVESAGGCPAELTLDFQDVPTYRQAALSILDSYQKIGIKVRLNPIPKSRFYDVVGNPAREHDLVLAAWVPDWPNGSSIIPALFDGRLLRAHRDGGNYNLAQLDDPRIDALIDRARTEHDPDVQNALWASVDAAVLARGAAVPILYERGLAMYGSGVRGAVMQSLYGEPDVLGLGVV